MFKDIIIVTHHLGGIGGVQRVISQLANSFTDDGNNVTVIGCGIQKNTEYQFKDVGYEEILLYNDDIFFDKPWLFFAEKCYLKKLNTILEERLRQNKNTIVILANPIVYLLMNKIIKKWKGQAIFIGQMHSSANFVLDSKGLYSIYSFIIKYMYPNLDKILFLTPEDSQIIQDAYLIDATKMGAIANPLPRYITREDTMSPSNKNIISFVGRLDSVKQVDHIIRAFASISKEFMDVYLNIYGDGEEREGLERLIKQLGVESRIYLMGKIDNVDIVYKKSLFTVLTSKAEGWPLSIVESMLMKTPVLSYPCSPGVLTLQAGTKEMLVYNGEVELANKMRYYLKNPSELISIGTRGQAYLEKNFSEKKILLKWYALFDSILEVRSYDE